MRKLIMIAALMALGVGTAQAAELTVKFAVENMSCATCPIAVNKAMKGVTGVKSAKADLNTQSAVVVFDDSATTVNAIAAASTNAGYPARLATN